MDPEYNRKKYDELARTETDSWARCAYKSASAQEMKFKAAQALIDFSKVKFLLDAGCGDGRFVIKILGERTKSIGIDVSEEMIKIARMRALSSIVWFRESELEKIDIGSSCFDCITCIGVIQCIKDEKPVLKEFNRVARHGAQLLIIGLDSRSVDPAKKPPGYDLYDRDPSEFAVSVEKSGFTVLRYGGIDLDGQLNTEEITRDFFMLARKDS